MFSQTYYVARSRQNGDYLTARLKQQNSDALAQYLLLFKEDFEVLSYLNAHASDLSDRFAVESVAGNQLGSLLKRWSFAGIGLVQDPLTPRIELMAASSWAELL